MAVVCGERSLTYRELDDESSRIARVLISRGVGPESMVAVAGPRSVESVLAVWAVAKAGGAFVPVDPSYPASRLEYLIADSAARCGITVAACVGTLREPSTGGCSTSRRREPSVPVSPPNR